MDSPPVAAGSGSGSGSDEEPTLEELILAFQELPQRYPVAPMDPVQLAELNRQYEMNQGNYTSDDSWLWSDLSAYESDGTIGVHESFLGPSSVEQKQASVINDFLEEAAFTRGSYLVNLIVRLTSHPFVFAFSEILAEPNVVQLQGTEYGSYFDILQLFSYGTWTDYQSNESNLPPLVPDQIKKLKQLTVLSLAEKNKVLSYDLLLEKLDLSNVRELEDFLIDECIYMGIVKGKLDNFRRSFEVQFAAGRDLRPGQLDTMIQSLTDWLATTDNLLVTIEEKIKWAKENSEMKAKHQKEVKDRVEELKKSFNHGVGRDFPEDDIMFGEPSGLMDYIED